MNPPPPASILSRCPFWLRWIVLLLAVIFGASPARASFTKASFPPAPVIATTGTVELTCYQPFKLEMGTGIFCGNDPVNRHDPTGLAWVYRNAGWVWQEAAYRPGTGNSFTDAFSYLSTLLYNNLPLPDVSIVGYVGIGILQEIDDGARRAGFPLEAINPMEMELIAALSRYAQTTRYIQVAENVTEIQFSQRGAYPLQSASKSTLASTNTKPLKSFWGGRGRPLEDTGVPLFDRKVVGTKIYENWKAALQRRGWDVTEDLLPLGTAAEANHKIMSVDANQFRYIDLLHESRHVRQLESAASQGVTGTNKLIVALFEKGAYSYNLRLGTRYGFSNKYMSWATGRIDDYMTFSIKRKFELSSSASRLQEILWQ